MHFLKNSAFGKFAFYALLIGLSSGLLLFMVGRGMVIHLPYFVAVLAGVGIGWLEPRKGWVLAVAHLVVLGLAYLLFSENFRQNDLEKFTLFGSMGLIMVGGFLGGLLRRKLG